MSEGEKCPVCGQSFDHQKKVWESETRETVRNDAEVCTRKIEGMKGKEVWIHV